MARATIVVAVVAIVVLTASTSKIVTRRVVTVASNPIAPTIHPFISFTLSRTVIFNTLRQPTFYTIVSQNALGRTDQKDWGMRLAKPAY